PKFGKLMKSAAAAINALSQADINELERNGSLTVTVDGQPCQIDAADVDIHNEDIPGWLVANEGNVTVALDITVTDELRKEGIARELVNRIQNIRKNRDYAITDRINVVIAPNDAINDAVKEFGDYIARQVLAESVATAPVDNAADDERLDLDGIDVAVKITVA
ncbi:MAG: isoleucine--tRNA ligase, partial [Muribaculaceae bacterium]|nr:isoleucine--tRNA ligase [Muribaculaceae bacterium]